MKGILLSLISFLFLAAASIISLRGYRGKKYFRIFLIEFPFACLCYLLLFYSLPDDLYFLPGFLLEPSRAVDFGNGFLILFLLFHMLWDASYGLVFTGFSSKLTLRLFQEKRGNSIEELMKAFGADEKTDDILAWRLPNLLGSKYISAEEGNCFRLLKRGRCVAKSCLFLKKLFKMDTEG